MNRQRNDAKSRLERQLVAARYAATDIRRPFLGYLIDMAIAEVVSSVALEAGAENRRPPMVEGTTDG